MTDQQRISETNRTKAKIDTVNLVPSVNKRKSLITNILTFGLLGAGFLFFGYIGYLMFWPVHPLNIKSIAVTTPVVSASGSMTYRIDACKNTDLTPIVYRKLLGKNSGIPFMPTLGVANRGCGVTFVTVKMNPQTTPGTYVLYTDVDYKVNILRDVHIYWHTTSFEVTQ